MEMYTHFVMAMWMGWRTALGALTLSDDRLGTPWDKTNETMLASTGGILAKAGE